MPKFRATAPDGTVYEGEFPDEATARREFPALIAEQTRQGYKHMPLGEQAGTLFGDTGRILADAMSFGLADRLVAGLDPNSTLEEQRLKTQMSKERFGPAGIGLELLGAGGVIGKLPSAVGAAKRWLGGGPVGRGATAGTVAATEGALQGGLESWFRDRPIEEGVTSGLVAGPLGQIAGYGIRGGAELGRFAKEKIGDLRGVSREPIPALPPSDVVEAIPPPSPPPGVIRRFMGDESGSIPPPGDGSRPLALTASQKRELKKLGYTGNDYKQGRRPVEEWERVIAEGIEKPKGTTLTTTPVPGTLDVPAGPVSRNEADYSRDPLTPEESARAESMYGYRIATDMVRTPKGRAAIRRDIAVSEAPGQPMPTYAPEVKAPLLNDPVLQEPIVQETASQRIARQRAAREAAGIPATPPTRTGGSEATREALRAAVKKGMGEAAPTTGPAAAVPPSRAPARQRGTAINAPEAQGGGTPRVPPPTPEQHLTALENTSKKMNLELKSLEREMARATDSDKLARLQQLADKKIEQMATLDERLRAQRVLVHGAKSPTVRAMRETPVAPTTGPAAATPPPPPPLAPHPDLVDQLEDTPEHIAEVRRRMGIPSSATRGSTGETSAQIRDRMAKQAKAREAAGPRRRGPEDPIEALQDTLFRGESAEKGVHGAGFDRAFGDKMRQLIEKTGRGKLEETYGPEVAKAMRNIAYGDPLTNVFRKGAKMRTPTSFASTGGLTSIGGAGGVGYGLLSGDTNALALGALALGGPVAVGSLARTGANKATRERVEDLRRILRGEKPKSKVLDPETQQALARIIRTGMIDYLRYDEDY